jgi:hypothetical protein
MLHNFKRVIRPYATDCWVVFSYEVVTKALHLRDLGVSNEQLHRAMAVYGSNEKLLVRDLFNRPKNSAQIWPNAICVARLQ